MTHYKYDPEYLDNMLPWERRIYLTMLENYVREKNLEIQRQMQDQGVNFKVEHPG